MTFKLKLSDIFSYSRAQGKSMITQCNNCGCKEFTVECELSNRGKIRMVSNYIHCVNCGTEYYENENESRR